MYIYALLRVFKNYQLIMGIGTSDAFLAYSTGMLSSAIVLLFTISRENALLDEMKHNMPWLDHR